MNEFRPERVVICGGAYSDNLGDAIIAECLKRELEKLLPEHEIALLDLAGRRSASHVHFRHKQEVRHLLAKIPGSIKRPLVFVVLGILLKQKIERGWREIIEPGDFLVIGGGHIFQDDNLNYPMKIAALDRLMKEYRARRAVYSVGVSREWSRMGRALFATLLEGGEIAYLSVRDEGSRSNLRSHYPRLQADAIAIDPDPALLVDRALQETGESRVDHDVGLCVADAAIVGTRGARSSRTARADAITRWASLIEGIVASGLSVGLLTNGATEDETFLDDVHAEVGSLGGVERLPRPLDVAGYVGSVRRMRCVVGHRLHASIVSYALGIPSMGFVWDAKVEAFYRACGRQEWVVDFTAMPVRELARKVTVLAESRIDDDRREELVASSAAGVKRLADAIAAAEDGP